MKFPYTILVWNVTLCKYCMQVSLAIVNPKNPLPTEMKPKLIVTTSFVTRVCIVITLYWMRWQTSHKASYVLMMNRTHINYAQSTFFFFLYFGTYNTTRCQVMLAIAMFSHAGGWGFIIQRVSDCFHQMFLNHERIYYYIFFKLSLRLYWL